MEKVETILYQAALAVTGDWQALNRLKLYEELGWESLSERRMCKRVLQIHKIVDGRTPSYLRCEMPPNRRKLANLPCVFQDIKCRTDRYLNSFFLDAISVWNNIISNFEYLATFGRLKNHLISLIRPKSRSTFDLHYSIYRVSKNTVLKMSTKEKLLAIDCKHVLTFGSFTLYYFNFTIVYFSKKLFRCFKKIV